LTAGWASPHSGEFRLPRPLARALGPRVVGRDRAGGRPLTTGCEFPPPGGKFRSNLLALLGLSLCAGPLGPSTLHGSRYLRSVTRCPRRRRLSTGNRLDRVQCTTRVWTDRYAFDHSARWTRTSNRWRHDSALHSGPRPRSIDPNPDRLTLSCWTLSARLRAVKTIEQLMDDLHLPLAGAVFLGSPIC
jgi:hypothetical protein